MAYRQIIITVLAAGTLALSGCVSQRPGGAQAPRPMGFGQSVLPLAAAAGGAAIGHNQSGAKGALIGAGVGAAVGIVGQNMISNWYGDQLDEAGEARAREERAKVMKDYWDSHAINGGNGQQADGTNGAAAQQTIMYPAGVYDGILYGPRQLPAPKP